MTGTRGTLRAPRLAGWFFLVLGLAGVVLAGVFPDGSAVGVRNQQLWLVALASLALSAAAFLVPWATLPGPATLALPAAALLLLVLVEVVSDYSAGQLAAAIYPIWVVLVLTWVGLTQPRTTAAVFALCAGAALTYVLLRSGQPALPVSSLLIILPAGVALGETCAWLGSRIAVLAEREEQRAHHLDQLTQLTSQLPGLATPQEAAALVARAATELFEADWATVELADPEGSRVSARAGVPASGLPARTVPLVGASLVVGTVRLGLHSDEPDDYTDNLARLFASQVGTALEQFQVIRHLDRVAHRDDLTGIGNRRHAQALLESLLPGDALLLVDLDHFKTVNDTWGHRAGDEVLQALGAYLQTCVRSADDVARYGGDEFVVLARGAGADTAVTADRLLRGWRQAGQKTTISIGAAVHGVGQRPEAVLDAADGALYAAKSQGRNQVAIDDVIAPI
jgi:diguanylate cyclase (GGDEF)-like protein